METLEGKLSINTNPGAVKFAQDPNKFVHRTIKKEVFTS